MNTDFQKKINIIRINKNIDDKIELIIKYNFVDLMEYFVDKGVEWDDFLFYGAKCGKIPLVKYLMDKGANDSNYDGIYGAACSGSQELVDFFIKKTPYFSDWNECMMYAAQYGHVDLIHFFMKKGANDWNSGMIGAARGNNKKLVDFFIAKGANRWNWGIQGAAESGSIEMVKFFLPKNTYESDKGLSNAIQFGHLDLVKFLIYIECEETPVSLEWCMQRATCCDQMEIVKYCVEQGATNWHKCFEFACRSRRTDMMSFFFAKIKREYQNIESTNYKCVSRRYM